MIETLQSHWGFTVTPFTATIPVAGLSGSAAHKEAVARLRWLISARGLGVLTGEAGSGKTAAVRAATDGLDASRNTLIYLPNPQIGTRGIHGAVAMALGQAPRFHHATLIPQVEAALADEADERNRHVILAIDESHLMTHDQLEADADLAHGPRDQRLGAADRRERVRAEHGPRRPVEARYRARRRDPAAPSGQPGSAQAGC